VITLYELHWSHYCEKIRWALDYKKLAWKKVNINAFTKREIKKFSRVGQRHLVPLIEDSETQTVISDSSPILRYLEETYPESPALFPDPVNESDAMYQYLIELDSTLGVVARKLGYTQIILENPGILSQLFLSDIWKGFFNLPGLRKIAGMCLGMLLIKRFGFELNESRYLYEALENDLLILAEKRAHKKYWLNDRFSAVDMSLAVYLRPLLIVPFFREHPGLQGLFEWQQMLFREHHGDEKLLYEVLIENHRQRRAPVRRKIRDPMPSAFMKTLAESVEKNNKAFNDHESVWTRRIWRVPYYYFFKISANKVRQREASAGVR